MSTDTPERTHDADPDPDPDSEDDYQVPDGEGNYRTPDSGGNDPDELVVAVYPRRVHEQVRTDLDDRRDRPCREYEAEYADLLAERARLVDEVAALERQLERAESRLDAVVERYERILATRDDTDPERLAGGASNDDEQTGRPSVAGPVAHLKNWLR